MNRQDAKATKYRTERGIEDVAAIIIDFAIKVHRALGPALLESVYQGRMEYEGSLRASRLCGSKISATEG